MIIGGGQISIGLAYCLFPLVIGLFWRLTKNTCARNVILASLALALQVSFEPRIAYLAAGTVLLYLLFCYKLDLKKYLFRFFEPLFIVFCLHFYWILPFLMVPKQSFSGRLVSTGWLSFLNFANFSNSFSLLHPNWPENIFGKIYFMRPEFLVIPILAYSSLLFVVSGLRVRKNILFFALLGLIGAFLAKGANPPFGQIYVWFYENIPGMELFRDSTKFYVLVALSYSILIPFAVGKIYTRLKKKARIKFLDSLILLAFCCFWVVLVKPAFLRQLGGTLKIKPVPSEYIRLKNIINEQAGFFRTFWVPTKQRFGFVSGSHPAINSENYMTESFCEEPFCSLAIDDKRFAESCQKNERCFVKELSYLLNPKTKEIFSMMAVKYVIVPLDSEGEIFLSDRKYDVGQRQKVESLLNSVSWLNKIDIFEKIALYEVASYRDHLSMYPNGTINNWEMISPTRYRANITVENPPSSLVFSESFNNLWLAEIDGNSIPSEKYLGFLNSFAVNKKGNFEVEIEYKPQKYIWIGLLVTGISLISCLAILCASCLKRKTNTVIIKT